MNKKNQLSSLYGRKELSDSYISFQIDLNNITSKFRDTKDFVVISPLKYDTIPKHLKRGIPLVSSIQISVSLSILEKCFKEIILVLSTYNTCSKNTLTWFEKERDTGFIKEITDAIISYNLGAFQILSEPTPLDAPTLSLATSELVKPMFLTISKDLKKIVALTNWAQGFCPICGDLPGFARLSKAKEGQRYLWCKKCDLEWEFPGIQCPYCGNTNRNKLKFLTLHHREELRIEVCNNCQGYIKAIDERKLEGVESVSLLKEHVASMFLDIIADEKGYKIQAPAFLQTKITFQ